MRTFLIGVTAVFMTLTLPGPSAFAVDQTTSNISPRAKASPLAFSRSHPGPLRRRHRHHGRH